MKQLSPERNSGIEKTTSGMDRRGLIKGAAVASALGVTGLTAQQKAKAAQLGTNESVTGSVEVGGYRLRLVSTDTGFGIAANVYSYKETKWIEIPRWVPTIAAGQDAAEEDARQYLRRAANLELPAVKWMLGSSHLGKD